MSALVDVKTLTIDGQEVSARAGQTILEESREHDINIPTLCHLDGLSDVGACRLCVVEIKGNTKLFPACVTTVFEGMEVTTNANPRKHGRTSTSSFCSPSAITSARSASRTATAIATSVSSKALLTVTLPVWRPGPCPSMPRTSGSRWTTIAASSARAACVCARRLKARTYGM